MPGGTACRTPSTQNTFTAPHGAWSVDRAGHRNPVLHTLGQMVEKPVPLLPHRPAGQSMDTPSTQYVAGAQGNWAMFRDELTLPME